MLSSLLHDLSLVKGHLQAMMNRISTSGAVTSATIYVTVATCRLLLVSARVLVVSVVGGLVLAWISTLLQTIPLGH